MSVTENAPAANAYRLEIRQGRAGWRYHVRGPAGIVMTAPLPSETRQDALEEGRAQLQEAGVGSWDEWMDGETNHFFDPRTARMPKVDRDAEAKAAGVDAPSATEQDAAVAKLRELEARREAAIQEAVAKRDAAPADSGMGVDNEPKSASPLKAQSQRRKKASAASEE